MIFRGFRNLSNWWRFFGNFTFIICLKDKLKTHFGIFPLRPRTRPEWPCANFSLKWFFGKNISPICSKFGLAVGLYPAHNRLDFEKNPIISSDKNSEKTKKNYVKCKNTKILKINTWHMQTTVEGGFWPTIRYYDVWFWKKLETAPYFIKWRKPFILIGMLVCMFVCPFVSLSTPFFRMFFNHYIVTSTSTTTIFHRLIYFDNTYLST